MSKLLNIVCAILLVSVVSAYTDDDGDDFMMREPADGPSLEVYRYYLQNSDDTPDFASLDDGVQNKREVPSTDAPVENKEDAQPREILFSDLIGKVEGSIVQSAVNIASLLKASKNGTSTTVAPEAGTSESSMKVKRSLDSVEDATSAKNKDTVVKYVTAKKVTETGESIPRIVIDHISVSDAKAGLAPLLSSLDFLVHQAPKIVVSTITDEKDDGSVEELTIFSPNGNESTVSKPSSNGSTPFVGTDHTKTSSTAIGSLVGTTPSAKSLSSTPLDVESSSPPVTKASTLVLSLSSESVETESSSTVNSIREQSTRGSSSSIAEALETSTTPSVTTSTKTPIEKLKEAEDELKEKVAEIEAEPIILSARV